MNIEIIVTVGHMGGGGVTQVVVKHTVTLLLLLLLLRNPQNQTEYDYEKINLTIMVTC